MQQGFDSPREYFFLLDMPNLSQNINVLKFCPKCGASADLAELRKIVCGACGFVLYVNTAAAVAGLIFDEEDRLLFMRRNHPPQKGLLDLPGGFADYGETGEAALARELGEELGLAVGGGDLEYCTSIPNTYEYGGVVYNTLDLFFKCKVTKSQLDNMTVNDEAEELVYKKVEDLRDSDIAFESVKRLLKHLRT